MSTTLENKLRSNASAYSALSSLLGTAPFRWWDTQFVPGSSPLPVVVVFQVDNPRTYALGGRLPTGWNRIQFTIWATGREQASTVKAALIGFLDQFQQAIGKPNLIAYPNLIVNDRDGLYAETQPPAWLSTIDAMIYSNDTL